MQTIYRKGVIYRLMVAVFAIAGLSGCIKTGSNTQTNTKIAFVTLMDMAPYAPNTEVYFNSIKQTGAVQPGSYNTNYGQLPVGAYSVQFKKAGGDSLLSELPAAQYDSMSFYTVILYSTADRTQAKSMRIVDDYSNLSAASANYRFFHLSPDVGAVDVYFNSTVTQTGRNLADNAFGGYYNSFQGLTPGIYDITVKAAGKDSIITTTSGANLQAAAAYTIFLQGSKNNSSNPIALKILPALY